MTWLSRILAAFLAATICLVVILEVFNSTILNSHYIENRAVQINAYSRLSDALSAELAKDINQSSVPRSLAELRLKSILTPQVLQTKINSALDGIAAYYKGNGTTPPTIDLTSLAIQARDEGLKIPANSQLSKPIVLASNTKARGVGRNFEKLRLVEWVAVILLLAVLLFTSWKRHRYAVLPDIAIICGVLLGIVAIIFEVSSKEAGHFIKFNFNSNAFASTAHDLAINILRNMGETIGIIAIILLIVGIITRILLAKLQPKPNLPSPNLV